MSKVTWNLKHYNLPVSSQLFSRRGAEMDVKSLDNFSKRNSSRWAGRIVKNTSGLLLILSGLFFFATILYAQEKEVEEIKVIREGPPPLEDPQYLDLGTFVVNMPGDKYFLKSSIQLAFENGAAKEWMQARMPIVKDLVITHLNSITVEQFDDTKNRAVIKNDLQNRLNSLFPNKTIWEDTLPVRRILLLEFYRQ
ncbi:MAG: flagellar basal body-associated FliL family protein [SAR324 cluster bacterium]|nr:flagellar basal body-associated FliL family protein [SAR324 cluster bacterium]